MEHDRREMHTRHEEIWDLLNDYADIRDELEDTLMSFQMIYEEIGFAIQDISDELTALNEHLQSCDNRLMRFKSPNRKRYEIIKEQDELPFSNET